MKKQNPMCRCGHRHDQHGKSMSVNYSAGNCANEKCKCKKFLHDVDYEKRQFTFSYKVGINGKLTRIEADMVYRHLESHSDTKRYIEKGEFGFAFVNYYKGIDVDREFSFREIDKMLKSLECPLERFENNFDLDLKISIVKKFNLWCESINEEYKKIRNGK